VCLALPEDELTEVLVRSDQECVPGVGLPQDFIICDAMIQLGDVDDGMPVPAQSVHDRTVDTLIGYQVHADVEPTG
jgi:hypothetical protein